MVRQIQYAVVVAGAVLLAALIYVDLPPPPPANDTISTVSSTIQLNERTIRVSVADTPAERESGLSGRASLVAGEGMLFVFPEDGRYAFWMKDMHFAIDILWISREGVIVDLEENVSPETYPATFTPRTEARYVVELPAGYAQEHGVRVGDIVRL